MTCWSFLTAIAKDLAESFSPLFVMTICSPNILKNGISDCRDKLSEDLSGQKQTERIFYQIFFN